LVRHSPAGRWPGRRLPQGRARRRQPAALRSAVTNGRLREAIRGANGAMSSWPGGRSPGVSGCAVTSRPACPSTWQRISGGYAGIVDWGEAHPSPREACKGLMFLPVSTCQNDARFGASGCFHSPMGRQLKTPGWSDSAQKGSPVPSSPKAMRPAGRTPAWRRPAFSLASSGRVQMTQHW